MQSAHEKLNRFFELAPQLLLSMKWKVLIAFFAITALMIFGMFTRFTMDMSLESWFQKDDPALTSLTEFRKEFGSDDGVYIVYETADGNVFSQKSLATLAKFHKELDDARYSSGAYALTDEQQENTSSSKMLTRIERVDSLINSRYQRAEGDTLISRELIGKHLPTSDTEVEAIRDIALGQENMALMLFSPDFRYAGIRLKTDFGLVPKELDKAANGEEQSLLLDEDFDFEDDLSIDESLIAEEIEFKDMQMEEYLMFMQELRSITEKEEYSHIKFYYTGNAPIMEFAMNNMQQASFLLMLTVVIVVGFLWVLFHSFSAVIWPIIVIAGSAFWMIGLGSLVGADFSNMVTLSFMLVLAVGVADCVHVLSAYILFREDGMAHREAMSKAYQKTGLPILLTTLTTMTGMLALTISDLPQVRTFGITSATGVFFAFVLTIFVLPALLDIWHPYTDKHIEKRRKKLEAKNKRHWLHPTLEKLPAFTSKYAKPIAISYFAIFALFIYGASLVKIDSNFAELTKEGSDIRITYDIIDNNMMGAQNMEIMMDFKQEDALKQANVLAHIDSFETHLKNTYPEFVIKTFSLANYVKDTHRAMNEGRNEFYSIPSSDQLVAQLLYLFDNANPEDRRNLVSDDYSKSHISVQLKNAGSYEYSAFFDSVQSDIDQHFTTLKNDHSEMSLSTTGSLTLMMKLIDHMSWTQLKSFSFALLIITIMLMFTLGSIQAGLISMLPNLLPAFFTFGTMGLLGIPLDTDTLIIAPLIIGIAVDDTIHFVAHYREAWFRYGDSDRALRETIKEVGQAVTFTTLILGVGFSMLAFSDYLGLAKTGIFGSLAIFVALSSDLLLLPALVKWFKPDMGRKKHEMKLAGESHAN